MTDLHPTDENDDPGAPQQVVALAEITGHLVTGVDASSLMYTLAERARAVIGAVSVSVVLSDADAETNSLLVASSSVVAVDRYLALGGPAETCIRVGAVVMVDDLAGDGTRWPEYASAAVAAGIGGVRAYPVRIAARTAGAVVVHTAGPWGAAPHVGSFVQAIADLVALSLDRSAADDTRLSVAADRRRVALDDNAVIEQAIGVLSERAGVDIAEATVLLVSEARARRRSVVRHARAVLDSAE